VYAVVAVISGPDPDAGPRMEWIEAWPRTSDGAIMATRRAMRLSVTGGPHEVHRPDGRMLARFVEGRRADLPPGGIIRLADAKAAAQIIDKVARHL
jgi:hypothetical protein